MKFTARSVALATTMLVTLTAAGVPTMALDKSTGGLDVKVDGIKDNGPIPAANALCKATPDGKSGPGDNMRPTISWSGAPKEIQSYTLIVSDTDVPADFSKAGKDGQVIAADAPRRERFFHWALLDIPAATTSIPGGKSEAGTNVGTPVPGDLAKYIPNPNNYGGPCPPWNDEKLHHYHFHVYALDVKSLGSPPPASAKAAWDMLRGNPHVLSEGEVMGTYTLNKAGAK